jgi:RND family efflux transporter MFP subunit
LKLGIVDVVPLACCDGPWCRPRRAALRQRKAEVAGAAVGIPQGRPGRKGFGAPTGPRTASKGPSLRILLVLLVAAALGAGGWLWWQARPPAVAVAEPVRGPAVEAVYATGTVEPTRQAQLASTVTGRIRAYPVGEGQPVIAGATLVQLDDLTARADLQALQARVDYLRSDLERSRQLLGGGHVSRQAYDLKVSELAQAEAAAEAQRQRLMDLTLVAPFDAVVLRRDHEVGEVVQPGDVLLWLGTPPPYEIEAQVDEEDIPRVSLGQTALIKADAFPGAALRARVAEITPMGDPVNKQYRVRLLLPPDSPLMIGMTVEANVVTRRHDDALLIPEGALVGRSVFTVHESPDATGWRALRRDVTLGVYGDGLVEVLQGLEPDARVIVAPPAALAHGDPVRLEAVADGGAAAGDGLGEGARP